MRKKVVIKKRFAKPDPKYSSPLVGRLIRKFMRDGEERIARKILYGAALKVEKITKLDFLKVLTQAIDNLKPGLEMKRRKVGGSYQRIPVKVSETRDLTLALQLLKETVRENKSAKPSDEKLAEEIINAEQNKGEAFKKKEVIRKEAESNRVLIY